MQNLAAIHMSYSAIICIGYVFGWGVINPYKHAPSLDVTVPNMVALDVTVSVSVGGSPKFGCWGPLMDWGVVNP